MTLLPSHHLAEWMDEEKTYKVGRLWCARQRDGSLLYFEFSFDLLERFREVTLGHWSACSVSRIYTDGDGLGVSVFCQHGEPCEFQTRAVRVGSEPWW